MAELLLEQSVAISGNSPGALSVSVPTLLCLAVAGMAHPGNLSHPHFFSLR